jgi:hypothetical protein
MKRASNAPAQASDRDTKVPRVEQKEEKAEMEWTPASDAAPWLSLLKSLHPSPVPAPRALLRSDLVDLAQSPQDYLVTDKSDGVFGTLLGHRGRLANVSKNGDVKLGALPTGDAWTKGDTVLEGEWVTHQVDRTPQFIILDVAYAAGDDVRAWTLQERIRSARALPLPEWIVCKRHTWGAYRNNVAYFSQCIRDGVFRDAERSRLHYAADGLMFLPNHDRTCPPLKWKPTDKLTIDVEIPRDRYVPGGPWPLFLGGKQVGTMRPDVVQQIVVANMHAETSSPHALVMECRYTPAKGWVFVNVRPDKHRANAPHTALTTMMAQLDALSWLHVRDALPPAP